MHDIKNNIFAKQRHEKNGKSNKEMEEKPKEKEKNNQKRLKFFFHGIVYFT